MLDMGVGLIICLIYSHMSNWWRMIGARLINCLPDPVFVSHVSIWGYERGVVYHLSLHDYSCDILM